MEIEVSQVVFSLKITRVAQAGFADVDRRHPSIGFAQPMDRRLGRSTAGHQDLSIGPGLLRWPQKKGQCPTPIRVPIEIPVPLQVSNRRWIRVAFVKSAHHVRWSRGRWCFRLFPSHVRLFVPLTPRQVRGTRICHSSIERSRNRTERCPGRPDRRPSIRFGRVTCG
jgi:hypothetical protein